MPMWLLGLLSPRMWFWAGILLLVAALGVQTLRLEHAQTALATEKADRAQEAARLARIARERAEQNATIQAKNAAETIANADRFDQERARLANDNARLAVTADGLRADVERYTAGAAGAAADATACKRAVDRARTLGKLFRQADSLAEELARAAEQRNAEVRALKGQLTADRQACNPTP